MNMLLEPEIVRAFRGFRPEYTAILLELTCPEDAHRLNLPHRVSADQALAMIRSGQRIDRGVAIVGQLVLEDLQLSTIHLNYCIFLGGLVIRRCQWRGINLQHATVVFGDFVIVDCQFFGDGNLRGELDLSDVTCQGITHFHKLNAFDTRAIGMQGYRGLGLITIDGVHHDILVDDSELRDIIRGQNFTADIIRVDRGRCL